MKTTRRVRSAADTHAQAAKCSALPPLAPVALSPPARLAPSRPALPPPLCRRQFNGEQTLFCRSNQASDDMELRLGLLRRRGELVAHFASCCECVEEEEWRAGCCDVWLCALRPPACLFPYTLHVSGGLSMQTHLSNGTIISGFPLAYKGKYHAQGDRPRLFLSLFSTDVHEV